MEQMILSKNENKQTKKTETDYGQEEQTQGFQEGKGREWEEEPFWGFGGMHVVIFEMDGLGSYCTAQGNMYDWVTLL